METWSKYYLTSPDKKQYYRKKYTLPLYNSNEIFIYQSIFLQLKDGGLTFSSDGLQIMHNECIFDECSRNGSGGGAVLMTGASSIVQVKTLSTNCTADATSQFCDVNLQDSKNVFGFITDASISNCYNINQQDHVTLQNGIVGVSSTNVSKSSVIYHPGIVLYNTKFQTSFVNFSNIESCYSTQSMTTYCGDTGSSQFNKCNIINCSQRTTNYGIIHANNIQLILDSCCIQNCSKNGAIFSTVNACIIRVQQCYYDFWKTYGNVINDRSIENITTYDYSFFANYLNENVLCEYKISHSFSQPCKIIYAIDIVISL